MIQQGHKTVEYCDKNILVCFAYSSRRDAFQQILKGVEIGNGKRIAFCEVFPKRNVLMEVVAF